MLTQSQEKYREVLEVAENVYRQNPDWVTFFRKIVGVDGAIRKGFPSYEELANFEQSEEFDKIQKMLVKLREKRTSVDPENEPTRVITVRLPKSMHEYLRTEAHDLRTSMNKLCISKLLQVIDEKMIPNERTGGGGGNTKGASNNSKINNNAPSANNSQAAPTASPATTPTLSQPTTQTAVQASSPFKPAQPRF